MKIAGLKESVSSCLKAENSSKLFQITGRGYGFIDNGKRRRNSEIKPGYFVSQFNRDLSLIILQNPGEVFVNLKYTVPVVLVSRYNFSRPFPATFRLPVKI